MFHGARIPGWGLALLLVAAGAQAQNGADPEAAYVAKFQEHYKKVADPPGLQAYATVQRYDELYLGESLDKALKKVDNDKGGLAWGLSYRMMSLNDLYKITGDRKYLDAQLRIIRAALAATDDKRGKQLWNGRVVAAWGCDLYAERGRAIFAVHTGIICGPIFDFLGHAKGHAAFRDSLGAEFDVIVKGASDALAVHDRQWRDGPAPAEGHYIGMDQENVLENKPLPGNRLSAMGWALWSSWKITGNTTHRDRALAIGRYIKNRLTPSPDGAYYWPYWLPEQPVSGPQPREAVKGEDVSHAGLTMQIVNVLAADREVFTAEDLQRLARTVLSGFGQRTDGVLGGCVTGLSGDPSHAASPAKWIFLGEANPDVRERIVAFYLNYVPVPGPLDIARLLLSTAPEH